MSETEQDSYARAGVNVDTSAAIKQIVGKLAKTTYRPGVLSGVGFFGGLFEPVGYQQPVLVSSVDGVGTKLKIAAAMNKHDTVGVDIVNHCVNDIFTSGADPLFFLDYIAMGKLVPAVVESIAEGLSAACRDAGCALIGGETAEMPGIYSGTDYDLVGFIIGAVEKENIIRGDKIISGDFIFGLPSTGLHTNGYSLVRHIFGTADELSKNYPELGRTLGEALLEPHHSYYKILKPHLGLVKGMAHITGGGLIGNIPRVLPAGLMAKIDSHSWEIPPLFSLIQERGQVSREEMFHIFNMGVGMAVIVSPENASLFQNTLRRAVKIGRVTIQEGDARVMIDGTGYHRDKVR